MSQGQQLHTADPRLDDFVRAGEVDRGAAVRHAAHVYEYHLLPTTYYLFSINPESGERTEMDHPQNVK